MSNEQQLFIATFGIVSFIGFLQNLHTCMVRKNSYGTTKFYGVMIGAFVNADVIVFGLFFALVSLVSLLLNDWILFLLIYSLYWLVRCIGETIYWFLQQFAPRNLDPKNYWLHRVVGGEPVWFIHQIFWQCLTVVSIVTSIYLSHLWLTL